MESFPQMERCLENQPAVGQEWRHQRHSVKEMQNYRG